MDFFEYASIAMNFTNSDWVPFLVGGLCFAIVFVFEAIALFVIASREGYKNKWMAFVPFLNTYYIGVCAHKNSFYNLDTKKLGIAAAVFEFVLFSLWVVFFVAQSLILNSGIAPTITTGWLGLESYFYQLDSVPSNLRWAAWMYNYMSEYILSVLGLLFLLLRVSLLISFYQTYACRRYVLFTITSILFPIQGILFFVVRNNKGVNYREFLRAEQERQYRMYQQYYQQNNINVNPYDGNAYNNPPQNGGTAHNSAPDDPFGGLGGTNGTGGNISPFDDFDKN